MWSYFKITCWAVVWLSIWIIIAPMRKGRDNCLTWAMDKYDNEGGYLVIRWCRTSKFPWFRWPHFLWLAEEHHHHLEHVIPKDHAHDIKPIPCPWFDPRTKQGDADDDNPEN